MKKLVNNFNLYCKVRYKATKTDQSQLVLIISKNKKQVVFPIQKILNSWWNFEKQAPNKNSNAADHVQAICDNIILKASKIILKFNIDDKILTSEQLVLELSLNNSADFWEYAYKIYLPSLRNKNTFINRKSKLKKLKIFAPHLKIAEINDKFLKKYADWCFDDGNCDNTVWGHIKCLKTIVRAAYEDDLIRELPFKKYKLTYTQKKKETLTIEEIYRIEKALRDGLFSKTLENVATYFLFACFTGLRFSDVENVWWNNIKNNVLSLNQKKTAKPVSFKLNNMALKYMPDKKHSKVFRTFTNQRTNIYLKVIAKICDIDKNVTFHMARHSFATISMDLNTNIHTLKELLGHEKMASTMIYAQVTDKKKQVEVDKWNSLEVKMNEINNSSYFSDSSWSY